MRSRAVFLFGCVSMLPLLPACSLLRVAVEGEEPAFDAGADPDAGQELDAGPGLDARTVDASVEIDAGQDSGPPPEVDGGQDAGQDGGQDAGPPVLRSCNEIYDSLTSYRRCEERPTECEFYTLLAGSSCEDACAPLGGCIDAFQESWSNSCARDGDAECGDHFTDAICICARIP